MPRTKLHYTTAKAQRDVTLSIPIWILWISLIIPAIPKRHKNRSIYFPVPFHSPLTISSLSTGVPEKDRMDASEEIEDRGRDRRVRSFQTTWLGMSQLRSPPVETVETQATPFFCFLLPDGIL